MVRNVLDLKTNQDLLCALEKAAHRKQTADEILEQRVSFVYGSVGSENGVTREQVRMLILGQEGAQGAKR